MIDWPVPLAEADGLELLGSSEVRVLLDFEWEEYPGKDCVPIEGGQQLVEALLRWCPGNLEPILILSTRHDIEEGHHSHDEMFVVAVNVDDYTRHAAADVAYSYLSRVAGRHASENAEDLLGNALNGPLGNEVLRHWASVNPDRLLSLLGVVRELGDVTDIVRGREQETAGALVALLQDDVWRTLEAVGAEIPEAIAQHRIWSARDSAMREFEQHVTDSDWDEPTWQRFFSENTWIFGFGLRYQFLNMLAERPYTGGRDFSRRGGQESDYLFSSGAERRFTVLVDIKRPDAKLVQNKMYRNRVHRLGKDLIGGVTQVQQQCWRWELEGSTTEDNRELLSRNSAHGHRPAGILVVGNTRSLDTQGKLRTFESFRRSLDTPEVLTFDEMLERGKRFVELSRVSE